MLRLSMLVGFVFLSFQGGKSVFADSQNQANWLYNEPFRNQYHYSAQKNWLNDPNGLLYDDTTGTYHMFYQYNPAGNSWGNMSWGHATSSDMINWQEQGVAIPELENQEWEDFTYTNTTGDLAQYGEVRYVGKPTTNWGDGGENGKKYIFSGSAIIDKNNASGLGENTILAFYTSCFQIGTRKNDGQDGGLGTWIGFNEVQEQHLAYSTDGGKTFKQYSADGNETQPKALIPVTMMPEGNAKDFRDPKVVYDEGNQQWLMIVVSGQEAQIYKSKDLLSWEYASKIERQHDVGNGVWECPELIPMTVEGTSEQKWILSMSVQKGAPASGSGMQYMIGTMNAQGQWLPDSSETLKKPLWTDYGEDYYAGVTFSNVPDKRTVMLAWMSNWEYVNEQQTDPWYSHMATPRELKLVADPQATDGYSLRQMPVKELDTIQKETIQPALSTTNLDDQTIKVTNFKGTNYKVEARFNWTDVDKPSAVGILVRASDDLSRKIYVGYDIQNQLAYVNRLATGEANIGGPTRDKTNTPVAAPNNQVELTALVDESSVEVFVNDGEKTISQVFYFRPEIIGNIPTNLVAFYAENGKSTVSDAKVSPLNSIFGELEIVAKDIEIQKGHVFDPMTEVSASNRDALGNKSTIVPQVLKNTVDTAKEGSYEVVYALLNEKGKYQEKTRKVTVVSSTPETSSTSDTSSTTQTSTSTTTTETSASSSASDKTSETTSGEHVSSETTQQTNSQSEGTNRQTTASKQVAKKGLPQTGEQRQNLLLILGGILLIGVGYFGYKKLKK